MNGSVDLSSPRLTLRPVRPEDVDALHRHWTDPDVRRYLWDDEIVSRAKVADVVGESVRRFAAHGHGLWALRRARHDALIGCVGLWTFHEPPGLELVISLSPTAWGRGLAAEAVRALLGYAFGPLGMDVVNASTDTPNRASRRLLERVGFSFLHEGILDGLPTRFYALSPSAAGSARSLRQ